MPLNNHLYYFHDSTKTDPGLFIYWPIHQDLIEPVLNQISTIFYGIYQLPLRLNSWNTVLQQLFDVIDMQSILPATLASVKYDLENKDFSHAPAIILRQGDGPQKDIQDHPVMCTTVDVSKLQQTGDTPIVLNKEQVDWLTKYFTGKIKVNKHENNK